jgi:hypothetical protein
VIIILLSAYKTSLAPPNGRSETMLHQVTVNHSMQSLCRLEYPVGSRNHRATITKQKHIEELDLKDDSEESCSFGYHKGAT